MRVCTRSKDEQLLAGCTHLGKKKMKNQIDGPAARKLTFFVEVRRDGLGIFWIYRLIESGGILFV